MMSLKTKVVLIVIFTFILSIIADVLVQRFIVYDEFVKLERDEAVKNLARVISAIDNEVNHLDLLCRNWASRNSTTRFVDTPSKDYIETSFPISVFETNQINLVYLYDSNNKRIWGTAFDLEKHENVGLPYFHTEQLASDLPFWINPVIDRPPQTQASTRGVFLSSESMLLISARPVVSTTRPSFHKGYLVIGRFLNHHLIEKVSHQTQVNFTLYALTDPNLPASLKKIAADITTDQPYRYESRQDNHLRIYTRMKGVTPDSDLLVGVQTSKIITSRGYETLTQALITKTITGLSVLIFLLLLLKHNILKPLLKLKAHVRKIRKTNDMSTRIDIDRGDEIGELALDFNKMLQQLNRTRKKLAEQSHRLGMAEVASGAVHHIRNMINPFHAQLELLNVRLNRADLKDIAAVHSELEKTLPPNQRQTDLIRYIILANKTLINLIQAVHRKIGEFNPIINQMEKMLDDYQLLAYTERPMEPIKLSELIADTLNILRVNLIKNIVVEVDPQIVLIDYFISDRISLQKVITIVLTNAVESIRRKNIEDGKIEISCQVEPDEHAIEIRICDNGEGIRPEYLNQIFQRNFSTKRQGASGYGLHWCANTVLALNGRVYAKNRKSHPGACLHIVLPQNADDP